jgi:DUF971 family protein
MPSDTEPKSVRVNKTTGKGMEIDWKDGHQSVFTFQYLRDACPCAHCDEDREKAGLEFGQAAKPTTLLPMFKEPARPTEVTAVGKYAISFVWNDGHVHGIYSWELLRALCPCPECKSRREAHKLKAGGGGAAVNQ